MIRILKRTPWSQAVSPVCGGDGPRLSWRVLYGHPRAYFVKTQTVARGFLVFAPLPPRGNEARSRWTCRRPPNRPGFCLRVPLGGAAAEHFVPGCAGRAGWGPAVGCGGCFPGLHLPVANAHCGLSLSLSFFCLAPLSAVLGMGAPKGSCSSTGKKPPVPPTARSRKAGVQAGRPCPPCSRPRGDTPVRRAPGSSAGALHIALCAVPVHTVKPGSWCVPRSGIRLDWSKGPDPC